MQRFDRNDARLGVFVKALWDALVPESGECFTLQAEMVRAYGRLQSEHFQNGLCNYYMADEPHHGFADGHYPGLLVFLLEKLVANANAASDGLTVDYFADVLERAPRDWRLQQEINDIAEREHEQDRALTDAELARIDELSDHPSRLQWEELLDRLQIAVANYCLANPVLLDRQTGKPADERGVKDIRHVFEPPPAPAACARCNGKGWIASSDATQFPTMCSCKTPTVLH